MTTDTTKTLRDFSTLINEACRKRDELTAPPSSSDDGAWAGYYRAAAAADREIARAYGTAYDATFSLVEMTVLLDAKQLRERLAAEMDERAAATEERLAVTGGDG